MDQRTEERIEELRDAQEMLREAVELLKSALRGTDFEDSARAYLISNLEMSIDHNHEWLGRNHLTVQDAIDGLGESEE